MKRVITRKGFDADVREVLENGGVGVIPTDTIYGIVGSALKPRTVRRIYRLRRRKRRKPMIVLIASIGDLKRFGVRIDSKTRSVLKKLWPHLRRGYGGQAGKVSVILPIVTRYTLHAKKLRYLHRGTGAIAFRLPKPLWLRRLLRKTGPLVAPSANWEGRPPATTIQEAKKYFGNKVDFYVDEGKLKSLPSTLVSIRNGRIVVLRKGAGRV